MSITIASYKLTSHEVDVRQQCCVGPLLSIEPLLRVTLRVNRNNLNFVPNTTTDGHKNFETIVTRKEIL